MGDRTAAHRALRRLTVSTETEAEHGASPGPGARRAICDGCGARSWLNEGQSRTCVECGGPYRPMALLEGLVDRLFAPPAQHVSEFYPRHLKLIELMWTAEGRGRETYEALALEKVSYAQFVTHATPIVLRGLAEGWIEVHIPAAPTDDDSAYQMNFVDPDRWADELTAAFAITPSHAEQVRADIEGDPDLA
jgi:hypothetical protein